MTKKLKATIELTNHEKLVQELPKAQEILAEQLKDIHLTDIVQVHSVEELYLLLMALDEKATDQMINHYKESKMQNADKRVDKLITRSRNSFDLLNTTITELSAQLTDEYLTQKDITSKLIRAGKDMYLIEIKSMPIPFKIRLFTATGKKIDFFTVKKKIEEVKALIHIAEKS